MYIGAISFQVSGALLLLFFAISTKRKNVVRRFIAKGYIERCGNKINYNKLNFLDEYKNAYLNRLAFIYIALGYILGIWGEIGCFEKIKIFIFVVVFTIIIMAASYFFTYIFVHKSKKVNTAITNDELAKLNIDPTNDIVSIEEIDNIFE